ncbi:hypothetical protein ABPG72_005769 [Tetrahymena utriculariae]
MDDSQIENIFHEDNYYEEEDDDNDHLHKVEDGRKSDIIKNNEESEDEDDDEDESDDGSKNEEGSKKKKKKTNLLKEKKKTKRKVDIFRFKADMLTNQQRGIKFLYENIEKTKIFDKNEKGIFDELKALDKLVNYYKGWHFHFMPKYSYQYFLDRCTEFGKTSLIKTYMNNVRRIHKGELQWKDLVDQVESENQQKENNPNNPKEAAAPINQVVGSNVQAQNKNNNNQSILNDTNLSRTLDPNIIPKNIKDIYLSSNKLPKNNSKLYDSSYARSNDVSRNPNQSQQSQDSSFLDKNSLSQNQIKKNNSLTKDPSIQEYYEDEELNKIQEYDDELRILEEEISRQQKILEELDQQHENYESDDMDDIKIKKKKDDD